VVQVDVPSDPAAFASRHFEKMLRWGVGTVNRQKLQVAFPVSSFKQTGNTLRSISYEEALKPFKTVTTSVGSQVLPGAQIELELGTHKAWILTTLCAHTITPSLPAKLRRAQSGSILALRFRKAGIGAAL